MESLNAGQYRQQTEITKLQKLQLTENQVRSLGSQLFVNAADDCKLSLTQQNTKLTKPISHARQLRSRKKITITKKEIVAKQKGSLTLQTVPRKFLSLVTSLNPTVQASLHSSNHRLQHCTYLYLSSFTRENEQQNCAFITITSLASLHHLRFCWVAMSQLPTWRVQVDTGRGQGHRESQMTTLAGAARRGAAG